MYFLSEDEELFEKYTIWGKVSADIKKNLTASLSSIKYFLKRVTDEVTDFYNKGIPKVDFNHTCLALISLDSALKKRWRHYPQVFLKECKYIEEKNSLILLVSLMKNKLELFRFVFQKL